MKYWKQGGSEREQNTHTQRERMAEYLREVENINMYI